MDYERDYIMRMIKEMIKALKSIVLGTKFQEEPEIPGQDTSEGNFPADLIKMADKGQINEAENLLLEELDETDLQHLQAALIFYEHINEYTDEFLSDHQYTRAEIADGIREVASRFGIHGLAESLL